MIYALFEGFLVAPKTSKAKAMMPSGNEWAKLVTSNLVTLLGAYMVLTSNLESNDNTFLATVISRLETVEANNLVLTSQLVTQGIEIVKLREENAKLRGELTISVTRTSLFQSFLDSLPFPAWIKRKDKDGVFRMVMINNAYVHKFGKSKARYKNATDEEMWGKEVAQGFVAADEKVFKSKGYLLTKELFPKRGGTSEATWHSVWKFSVMLGDEKYGVGGIVVVDFVTDTHLDS